MNNIRRAAVVILCVLTILTAFAACGGESPEKLILGSWKDSNGMSTYIFSEDGSCTIKFEDLYIRELECKVKLDTVASYTVSEAEDGSAVVKLIYEIMAKTITKEYKFTVEEDGNLYLTDISDGTMTVYTPYTEAETSAPEDTTAA